MDCPTNLKELYELCKSSDNKLLRKLIRPICSLNNMIGMQTVKQAVCRQILFFIILLGVKIDKNTSRVLRDRKTCKRKSNPKKKFKTNRSLFSNRSMAPIEMDSDVELDSDEDVSEDEEMNEILYNRSILGDHFMHLLIQGNPGVGKTTLVHLIYNIWVALGIVAPKKLFVVTKADLVSGYLGKSVAKTRKLIAEAKGGVIAIDECYSLVSGSDGDQYGSEVLAEIINSMSNPLDNVIFFFCGYKKAIEEQLFTTNRGLKRRFGAIFTLDLPNPQELFLIFCFQLKQNNNWKILKSDLDSIQQWFASKHNLFLKQVGGSTQTLCRLCIEESVLQQFPLIKNKYITMKHIEKAFLLYQHQTGGSDSSSAPSFLYT